MPIIAEDTTGYLLDVFVQNLAQSGKGYTGLLYTDVTIELSFRRLNASSVVTVTLVASTLGSWTSGGFLEADDAKQPGIYQVGVPNAVCVAPFLGATLYLNGPMSLFMAPVRFELALSVGGGSGGFLLT